MKIFMKIMLYLSFLWLVLVYLFVVSAKDKWVYIEIGLIAFFSLILSFLFFFFLFRQNKKSYKNLAAVLFLLTCITIIVNCIPQTYIDDEGLMRDEIAVERTFYLILEQGVDFYFLNIVVFLTGLLVYLYQSYLQKN